MKPRVEKPHPKAPPKKSVLGGLATALGFFAFSAAWAAVAWLLAGADPGGWPNLIFILVGLSGSATGYFLDTSKKTLLEKTICLCAFGLSTAAAVLSFLLLKSA